MDGAGGRHFRQLAGDPGRGRTDGRQTGASIRQHRGDLAHLPEISPLKLRQSLFDSFEQLRLNERLATLRPDVALGDGPWAEPLGAAGLAHLQTMFGKLEFTSLQRRLHAIEALLLPSGA